ncbi:ATP-binding protein [Spirochaeta lutea]|uniref:ATP-binding protein n=1 Tax=Spirochaeta lutea TaxID=1480694 RepID=UPI00068B8631|nr:ATP-binding protein [Spirochaeta lutea]
MQIYGFCPVGYEGILVAIEIEVRKGIPGIDLVGLPDSSVREARERVRAAIRNSGFSIPRGRILINLRPAGIRKVGASYDMALAVAILCISNQITLDSHKKYLILGELSLSGEVCEVKGLPGALDMAAKHKIDACIGPADQLGGYAPDAGLRVHGLRRLTDLLEPLPSLKSAEGEAGLSSDALGIVEEIGSFSNLSRFSRYAGTVALAGRHHVNLLGPPGSGKTSLLEYLQSFSLPLRPDYEGEVQRISGLVGDFEGVEKHRKARVRTPHHTTSFEGMFGGGRILRPGEVSLAHCGMLILDELSAFQAKILSGLRLPMEQSWISVGRADMSTSFPCDFMLVAAMNLCPCGGLGSDGYCLCDPRQLSRYWTKIGAALMDRFDIRIFTNQDTQDVDLPGWVDHADELSMVLVEAENRQFDRRNATGSRYNGRISGLILRDMYPDLWSNKSSYSARDRAALIRIAVTLADLDGRDSPNDGDLSMAGCLRFPALGPFDIFGMIGK